jgi:hypothetical protein
MRRNKGEVGQGMRWERLDKMHEGPEKSAEGRRGVDEDREEHGMGQMG